MNKDTSEIVKLTERISKDPKSKLFVPLAEEYKKIGDIEMAIHVLSEGLKNNPVYVTARSLLGRLLYENGDLVAAQKEFEEVVKAIPDNLLAQTKLGELYSLQNHHTEALKHYRIALALNSSDKSLAALVSKLEESVGAETKPEWEKGPVPTIPGSAKEPEGLVTPDKSASTASVPLATSTVEEQQQPPKEHTPPLKEEPQIQTPQPAEEKTAEIKESADILKVQGQISESADNTTPLSPMPEKQNMFAEPEQAPESFIVPSEMEEPEEVLVVEPIDEEPSPEEPSSAEEPHAGERVPEIISSDKETSSVADISIADHERPKEEPVPFGEQEEAALVAPESPRQPFEVLTARNSETELNVKLAADESDDFTTDTLAELYIAQGFYEKAIDIYERMMADRPDSMGLKAKLERVRAMASENPPEEYASAVMESIEALETKKETSALEEQKKEYTNWQEETIKQEEAPAAESLGEITKSNMLTSDKESPPPEAIEKDSVLLALKKEVPEEGITVAPIGAESKATSILDDILDESKENKPEAVTEEHAQAVTEAPSGDIFASSLARESSKTTEASLDFEPREYIPPDASPRVTKDEKVHLTPRQSITSRKETIDRLENWLKNIKKER